MIALVASLLLVCYVLVPGGIFRAATSLAIPLKKFYKTRTQEITFAVVASLVPFCLTMLLVVLGGCDWPFSTKEADTQRFDAYHVVFTSFVSDTQFNEAVKHGRFWPALTDVGRRQTRFLCWYYFFIVFEASLFWWHLRFQYKKFIGRPWYDFLAEHFLLPSISEWHVMLSSFAIKCGDEKDREVHLDLLTTDNVLYRGKLADYFTNADGDLSGVLLEGASRFKREAYLEDMHADQAAPDHGKHSREKTQPRLKDKESYWQKIPGADLFYIPKERISNFNVRHEMTLQALLKERGLKLVEKPKNAIGGGPENASKKASSSSKN